MIAIGQKEFTGRHMLIVLASFFGVMFAVNAVFIYLAVSTFTGLDRETAYQDGLNYNITLAEAREQAALGWSHRITFKTSSAIELTVTGANGESIRGLTVSGQIERPVATGTRRSLILTAQRDGVYAASTETLAPGSWIVTLKAVKARPGAEAAVYRLKERLWLTPD